MYKKEHLGEMYPHLWQKLIVGVLLVFVFSQCVFAQTFEIKGKISDKTTKEPLIGAAIEVKGKGTGTVADLDGQFVLSGVAATDKLIVTYLGYAKQEILVGSKKYFDILMSEDAAKVLDEVVVIGYGSVKKKDLTGSVSQIRPDKLSNESPATVEDILRMGAVGLHVGISNTAKGNTSLQIRGQRSLKANTSPLIVVDNMIFFGELSEINPQDIEQIDVLKDASASAIYGAKSANGVIIITTKKGKSEKPTIRLDASYGFVTMGANRDLYDAEGYLNFRSDLQNASNGYATPAKWLRPTAENLQKYGISIEEWRAYTGATTSVSDDETWLNRLGLFNKERENYFNGKTYDWYDASFQTGSRQDYNVSVSGNSKSLNYYFSLGYYDSKGVIVGDEYKTIRSNLKLNASITKFLEIGANVNFQNRTDGNLAIDWNRSCTANSPYALPYDEDGNLELRPMGVNPLNEGYNYWYDLQYSSLDRGYTVLNTILNAKIKLPFNINYTISFAPRFQWYWDRFHQSSQHPLWQTSHNGAVNREQSKRFDWLYNQVISWEYTFNEKHSFNLTLSHEAEEHRSWKDRIEARDFSPTDALGFHYVQNANKLKSAFSCYDDHSTGDALLGRVIYGYDDRYTGTFTVRRDGYSAFGSNNPRATFYSGAFAWNFANEKFFKWEAMSQGKLRLSYGTNGNREIGIYSALSGMSANGVYPYIDPTDNSIRESTRMYVNKMQNLNLKWEKTASWNVGLDFGFLGQRINGSIDAYYMPTTDVILDRSLPTITSFGSVTSNLGEIVNKGVEITLNSVNISRPNFEWSSTATFSLNRNEIKHLYGIYTDILDEHGNIIGQKEMDDVGNRWFIGHDINEIWDYKLLGIWQLGEEEEAAKYGQKPGDPKVLHKGDISVRPYGEEDKEFLGSRSPKFRWSFRNEFTLFKDFSLSMNLYSLWGHKTTDTEYLHGGDFIGRQNIWVQKYWTPENPTNEYASLKPTSKVANPVKIIDKSFIRLENISLAYRVPSKWLSKFSISALTLYGSVRNVAVWTKEWERWDPETEGPMPRTFTLGASVTF